MVFGLNRNRDDEEQHDDDVSQLEVVLSEKQLQELQPYKIHRSGEVDSAFEQPHYLIPEDVLARVLHRTAHQPQVRSWRLLSAVPPFNDGATVTPDDNDSFRIQDGSTVVFIGANNNALLHDFFKRETADPNSQWLEPVYE